MTGNNIEDLKRMLIMQMTGDDYVRIVRYANEPLILALEQLTGHVRKVEGVDALAKELGCSTSYVYDLIKKTRRDNDYGILTDAIISHIGKSITFDVEKARNLAMVHKLKKQ